MRGQRERGLPRRRAMVVVEDVPATVRDLWSIADALHKSHVSHPPEIGVAARSLVIERTDRLAGAPDRRRNDHFETMREASPRARNLRMRFTLSTEDNRAKELGDAE